MAHDNEVFFIAEHGNLQTWRMIMKKATFMILVLIMVLSLCGCGEEMVPAEAEARYIAYLEAAKSDRYTAVNEYCHYEDLTKKEISENSRNYIQSYEIIGWEKLSDSLWAVTAEITKPTEPNGKMYTHFVGLIDGKFYVMMNSEQVPGDLKENLDLEEYVPTEDNVVDDKDVIRN